MIAETGESRPKVIGEGTQRLSWGRRVIRKIGEAVKTGTKFFIGHNDDNSTDGRQSVGEIIHTFIQEQGEKLRAIALGVLNEDRPDLDVCSVEADIEVDGEEVVEVNNVSGVALGSSRNDTPAFLGARRLQAIQCFERAGGDSDEPGDGEKKENKEMTFEELKDQVRKMNVFPHQLFSEEQLRDDKVFGKLLADLEQTVEAKNKELKDVTDSVERKKKEADVMETLEKSLPEGLTDKQKAFIKRNFNPSALSDFSDKEISDQVESLQKEFSDYAKLFGVQPEGEPKQEEKGDKSIEDIVLEELTK